MFRKQHPTLALCVATRCLYFVYVMRYKLHIRKRDKISGQPFDITGIMIVLRGHTRICLLWCM